MSCCLHHRLVDGNSTPIIIRLNSLLLDSSFDIINNNIGHSFLRIYGLHLNEHRAGKLALNFVKIIRSILNTGSDKQKLKEVHSSTFGKSSDKERSAEPNYALLHNLNDEIIQKVKNVLIFRPLRIQ